MKILLGLITIISLTFLINGCGEQSIKSTWRTINIKIDGSQLDWDNNVNYSQELGTGLGLMNDGKDIYLCLNIKNPFAIERILKAGFVVWFSAPKDSDTVGVEFPVGSKLGEFIGGRHQFERNKDADKDKDSLKTKDTLNMHIRLTDLVKSQDKFDVVSNDKTVLHSYSIDSSTAIQAAITYQSGQLVYELKMPLLKTNDSPYAINADPGETISIGFQIGGRIHRMDNEQFDGEGYGEPNENEGYGGYGYQPQRQNVQRKSLSTWVKVVLANK